jgi:hypothetical protein
VKWRKRADEAAADTAEQDVGQANDDEEELPCNRCGKPLTFIGDRDFHEGTRAWGFVLGGFGELLTGGTKLEFWGCQSCGHVEFFLPGIE